MGLVEKTKCHRLGKMPLREDVKSWVGVSYCENIGCPKPPSCSICKQVGHNQRQCLMPPMHNKSKAELVSFEDIDVIEPPSCVQNKKEMVMVSAVDWM
jgi:hypothetical protein